MPELPARDRQHRSGAHRKTRPPGFSILPTNKPPQAVPLRGSSSIRRAAVRRIKPSKVVAPRLDTAGPTIALEVKAKPARSLDDRFHETAQSFGRHPMYGKRPFPAFHVIRALEALD
jgi:hypothetical protein